MSSYIVKMIAVMFLLAVALGVVSCDEVNQFSVDCSERKFISGGRFAKNVASILGEVLRQTPIEGENDFSTKTDRGKFTVFASGHCFISRAAFSAAACSDCLKQAILALRLKCANGLRASSVSSAARCIVEYDKVPLAP